MQGLLFNGRSKRNVDPFPYICQTQGHFMSIKVTWISPQAPGLSLIIILFLQWSSTCLSTASWIEISPVEPKSPSTRQYVCVSMLLYSCYLDFYSITFVNLNSTCPADKESASYNGRIRYRLWKLRNIRTQRLLNDMSVIRNWLWVGQVICIPNNRLRQCLFFGELKPVQELSEINTTDTGTASEQSWCICNIFPGQLEKLACD